MQNLLFYLVFLFLLQIRVYILHTYVHVSGLINISFSGNLAHVLIESSRRWFWYKKQLSRGVPCLEISQNSQGNICQSLFLIKLIQKVIKKEALAQVLSCEFWEIFKNTLSTELLRTTASVVSLTRLTWEKFTGLEYEIMQLNLYVLHLFMCFILCACCIFCRETEPWIAYCKLLRKLSHNRRIILNIEFWA